MLRAAAQNQLADDVDQESLHPLTSPDITVHDKKVTATLRLLKSNPNLTISQAMRAADFTTEESRDSALQLQIRQLMPTKRVTLRNIITVSLLCGFVLCALISTAHNQKNKPSRVVENSDTTEKTAICAIQKQGLKYIDEWIDYHLGIGFDKIYIYDNSDEFELKAWYSDRFQGDGRDHVKIIHFPGVAKQLPAYSNCTKEIQKNKQHSWIAFIDVDEFFVIKDTKKYPSITNVLDLIPQKAGGLAVNWQFFGWNNQTKYEAIPLTKRFTMRQKDAPINIHVKVIAKSNALKDVWPTPHEARYRKNKYKTFDTNGEVVDGPFNKRLPTDVLVLNHYGDRSIEEFRSRCARGRPSTGAGYNKTTYLACQSEEEVLAEWRKKDEKGGLLFDDSAWKILKERVPVYSKYETE